VARAYVAQLRDLLLGLGVSDVRMEQGSLRCDVNLSLAQAGSVLGSGLRWVGSGALLGTLLGAGIAHAFTGLLFGVSAVDAPTLAGALGLLLVTALLASAHPALRAARVSPAPALAAE